MNVANNDKARLLLVDDEAPQLQALSSVLREEGYDVVACIAPHEALDQLRLHRFDVLLSDLNMPTMDGIALTRHALELDPDIVPVLMTGQGSIPTAIEAMKIGALDYVLKPFRLVSMRPVLARAIDWRRMKARNRELGEDVARRNAQLEAANRELDAFAARIAHDLRGPVLAMLGFARVVDEREADRIQNESRDYLQRVIRAGERAERMIRDLLAFARLGESPLERKAVKLDAVVHAARQAVEPEVRGRKVEWQISPLPVVSGDPSLLEHVFVNLLSNAVKYTRPRASAHIEVGAQPATEGGHTIWVRDNGVGFDPKYARHLFLPFHRLHRADQFEGNGIGLAHVQRIVERHGGSVSADARPDQGATFSVTLPS